MTIEVTIDVEVRIKVAVEVTVHVKVKGEVKGEGRERRGLFFAVVQSSNKHNKTKQRTT